MFIAEELNVAHKHPGVGGPFKCNILVRKEKSVDFIARQALLTAERTGICR